jgi:hypothetical protein
MHERVLADALVVLHLAFILFVLFGGLLVAWRRAFAVLHLPALAWGLYAEATSTICPLTPLENAFRHAAGEAGYSGGFVEHYLVRVIYPAGLTPAIQMGIAFFLVVLNVGVYAWAWRERGRSTFRKTYSDPDSAASSSPASCAPTRSSARRGR